MVKYIAIVILSLATSWAADNKPDPYDALAAFKAYQKHANNPSVSERHLAKIERALRIDPVIVHGENGKNAPVLAFVAFCRTHFKDFHKPYSVVRQQVTELVGSADFEVHLYQLNDLHSDQGRRSIWQLSRDGVTMRVEVVPNNAIVVAFFSTDDFRSGLHALRRALIPPLRR